MSLSLAYFQQVGIVEDWATLPTLSLAYFQLWYYWCLAATALLVLLIFNSQGS